MTRQDYQADVRAFHERFVPDQIAEVPTVPPKHVRELRLNLIGEEFQELIDAFGDEEWFGEGGAPEPDIVAIADAIADLLYVTFGTAVACGIDVGPVWEEVHRSNMAKQGGSVRADGKILKPEGWQPPDVAGALARQAATVQQPTPNGSGPEIAPLVVADIEARAELGAEKYGEPLRANNGRDALVDLYQEILDAAMYVRQAIEESHTPHTTEAR